MKKRIGVLLSGCGFRDGAEINEAVLTLLSIDMRGAEAVCMAPDVDQARVINHLTGKTENEKRNVLLESARIARGKIKPVNRVSPDDLDALILPGGSGSTVNFVEGGGAEEKKSVPIPEVAGIIQKMHEHGKPIGAICIAPKTVVMALGERRPEVTIGNCRRTSAEIEKLGGIHVICQVDEIYIDRKNRIVTTPAYMLGPGIRDVYQGIDRLVEAVIGLCS